MADNVDTQELRRHQADFRGFMTFLTWLVGFVVVLLGLLAIFLL
jgi:hypothetical protein